MSVFSLIKPLAYISLPVFVLHTLSNVSPVARYYVRLGLYLSTLGVFSVWGAVVAVGLNIAGDKFNTNWVVARSFYGLVSRMFDIHLVLEGEEHLDTRPSILVGNHQSMLDILYIGRYVVSSPSGLRSTKCRTECSRNAHLLWPRRNCNGCLYLVNSCSCPELCSLIEEIMRTPCALFTPLARRSKLETRRC